MPSKSKGKRREKGYGVLVHEKRILSKATAEEQRKAIRFATVEQLIAWDADFEEWAHKNQLPPNGEGWRTWLMMAGRGFGKTRAGAEWIFKLANIRPVSIALIGATIGEARSIMVEGVSGLLSIGHRHRKRLRWEPSLGRLTWPNGSEAKLFSGDNADGLRGPEHEFAWADELAKWGQAEEAWMKLQFGLRRGPRPRALVTTTPRPISVLKQIEAHEWTVTTRGRTSDNVNLDERTIEMLTATYGGTRIGRQELDGELIEDIEGALWSRALLESCREPGAHADCTRIVIGVDPPASSDGDACGIVVGALGADGIGRVLADCSVRKPTPERWARAVANAARVWRADRVVAEANQGGEMVRSVLRAADVALPVKLVHASRGKAARAEPVAALYEAGRVRHAGQFPELEDQLCGLMAGGGYEGAGQSPDRADALVWAMTELMLGRRREPRVWRF